MADFSKQYCDKQDPGFPHDFDIEEEFKDIPVGHYRPIICEGYGFSAILNEDGVCKLLFTDSDRKVIASITLDELDTYYKENILPPLKKS